MIYRLSLLFGFLFITQNLFAQTFIQRFDGADTTIYSIIVTIHTDSTNIWQIGKPQKTIFDSAYSLPNVIVTDTVGYIPVNDTSSFTISIHSSAYWSPFVYAYQWVQKLDLLKGHQDGIIEVSVDSGATWHNVFNNPSVSDFYGFNLANVDTLISGLDTTYAFSGTDTSWKNIWLCFPGYYYTLTDSMLLRFTVFTDSVDSNKEGWMIDNFYSSPSFQHTAVKVLKETDSIIVYPKPTTGTVYIGALRTQKLKTIEKMQLINSAGQIVHQYGQSLVHTSIDISDFPDGIYYLKIQTNVRTSTYQLLLQR